MLIDKQAIAHFIPAFVNYLMLQLTGEDTLLPWEQSFLCVLSSLPVISCTWKITVFLSYGI